MKKLLFCFCLLYMPAMGEFGAYFDRARLNLSEFKNPFFYDEFSSKLHLQAIFDGKVKINDKWYQKGGQIDGATILGISAKDGSVALEKAQHNFHLSLKRANHKIYIH